MHKIYHENSIIDMYFAHLRDVESTFGIKCM